jgi:pimeloyl-ACP methyl ester carboxylesterase
VLLECFTSGEETGDEPWFEAMRDHLARLRSLPEVVAGTEEAAAAFRSLAPHANEAELRHWMRNGLVEGTDGRWTWRYDPVFRAPGPPGRLVPPMDVLRRRLTHVTCPVLFLVGAESWMVEPTARMTEANPRARMVAIPQAGHWVPLDNPAGFLKAVRGFLTEES